MQGGCSSVMGGAENKKGRKKEQGARVGPMDLGLGRFLGRVEREYIRVLKPFFLILHKRFSLFLPNSRFSLFSLLPYSSSPTGRVGGGGGGDAVAGRLRRRRRRTISFFF